MCLIPLHISFFQLLTHISKLCIFFSKLYTQIQELHTKCKTPHISCKMKHCVQNITNTSQKQTFANTFAIILIPVRFVCCVLQKVFYEIENWVKGSELVSGFADLVCVSAVWVTAFRNCVTSKDVVCKQLKKSCNEEQHTVNEWRGGHEDKVSTCFLF